MKASNSDSQPESMKFAALLLHDLETPIAVAKNFMKRLANGNYDPENEMHQELFKSTRLALDRAERILEDFIDQFRTDARSLQINRESTDITELTKECVDVTSPLLEDKSLRVNINTGASPPKKVEMDRHLIARVIDNYLVNAIRHSPLNSDINITIREKGSGIRLEIANKTEAGEAFDFDINEIFNAKSQVELREQRKARGSGLGLVFSKMVIEAHNGKTGAMRSSSSETVFWFEL